jgi:uncharacterized protein YaiL (DUF2058 family)
MSDSLRDQLLGLGFKASAPAPRKDARKGARPGKSGGRHAAKPAGKPGVGKGGPHPPRERKAREDIDLAKAYAIRAQREKDERIAAEQARQDAARARREALAKLDALMDGRGQNAADADIARHFEYGGKIKRVYVTQAQLEALNAGRLGVVQLRGRYVLVDASMLAEVEAVFPAAVALKVDPGAPPGDDPYADPRFQVPDDLTW